MSEFLVIRSVPEAPAMADWLVVDDQGALLEPGGREALSQLPARAANRRVLMLVPALDVLIAPVDLPVRGKQKIQQALPFAMEEQLADNVEDLHFAAGGRADRRPAAGRRGATRPDGRLAGAAGRCRPRGATRAASEAEGLDLIPGTAVLLIEPTVASLRSQDGELASTDIDGLDTLLALWRASTGRRDEEAKPSRTCWSTTVGDGDSARGGGRARVSATRRIQSLEQVRSLGESALPRLAANLAVRPGHQSAAVAVMRGVPT